MFTVKVHRNLQYRFTVEVLSKGLQCSSTIQCHMCVHSQNMLCILTDRSSAKQKYKFYGLVTYSEMATISCDR